MHISLFLYFRSLIVLFTCFHPGASLPFKYFTKPCAQLISTSVLNNLVQNKWPHWPNLIWPKTQLRGKLIGIATHLFLNWCNAKLVEPIWLTQWWWHNMFHMWGHIITFEPLGTYFLKLLRTNLHTWNLAVDQSSAKSYQIMLFPRSIYIHL